MRQRTDHNTSRCGTRVGATELPQIKPQGSQCSKGPVWSAMLLVAALHTFGRRWRRSIFDGAAYSHSRSGRRKRGVRTSPTKRGNHGFWQFYSWQAQPYHRSIHRKCMTTVKERAEQRTNVISSLSSSYSPDTSADLIPRVPLKAFPTTSPHIPTSRTLVLGRSRWNVTVAYEGKYRSVSRSPRLHEEQRLQLNDRLELNTQHTLKSNRCSES